jgi:hypothetical protein
MITVTFTFKTSIWHSRSKFSAQVQHFRTLCVDTYCAFAYKWWVVLKIISTPPFSRRWELFSKKRFKKTRCKSIEFIKPYRLTVRDRLFRLRKKNFLSTSPETRRKRSVCSRASKCSIERVSYEIFDKVMGIWKSPVLYGGCMEPGCIRKSHTNTLPTGKKNFFLKMQLKIRPPGFHGDLR